MPFYQLLDLLYEIGEGVKQKVQLLRQNQIDICLKAKYQATNQDLYTAWDDFSNGVITVHVLLTKLVNMKS